MKKVISIIFAIVLCLSASFAYTLRVDDGRAVITSTTQSGTTVQFGIEGQEGLTWSVTEGSITIRDIDGRIGMKDFVMPDNSNVAITLVRPGDTRSLTVKTNLGTEVVVQKEVGKLVEVTAEVVDGYLFQDWTVVGTEFSDLTQATLSFIMPANEVIMTANYTPDEYEISASASNGGSITPNGVTLVRYGQNQTYTIAPSTGYSVESVIVDGENKGALTSYTFSNVTAEHTIQATFSANTYTVSFNSKGGSSVDSKTVTYMDLYGTLPTPTKTGNTFLGWYKEETLATQVTAGTQVTTASDHTLYAKWVTTTTSFAYTGGIQTYTAPVDGVYRLEVWGGGGHGNVEAKGGYSIGYKLLTKGTVIYVVCGQAGANDSFSGNRFNGGRDSTTTSNPSSWYGHYTGAGCTHMATVTGELSALSSKKDKVLIVAGGGGSASISYQWEVNSTPGNGGAGGGLTGGDGNNGKGGTQTSGAGFGIGGTATTGLSGGGAGWYGGTAGSAGGGGGSGYIGGVPSFTYDGVTYSPSSTQGGGAAADVNGSAKITLVTVNEYTVTLNNQSATNAGTTSVTATYGKAMPSITVPTKTGYTFAGYYTSTGGGGTQYYKADGSSARNWDKTYAVTLYAYWTHTHAISYYKVSGSGAGNTTKCIGCCVCGKEMSTEDHTWVQYWNNKADAYCTRCSEVWIGGGSKI